LKNKFFKFSVIIIFYKTISFYSYMSIFKFKYIRFLEYNLSKTSFQNHLKSKNLQNKFNFFPISFF